MEMNETAFEGIGAYYDLLYGDKDYSAEAEYVSGMLRRANARAKSVLEFGAGTGRHGSLLASQGFQITGVERSLSMATSGSTAPSSSGGFVCIPGDIRTVTLDRTFDAVISLFHVVSYQTRNCDVLQTFINAEKHLVRDGLFLFDVWHGPAVLRERPAVRIKEVEDVATRVTRIAEPELDSQNSVVRVRYTILAESKHDGRLTTIREDHYMRYFFPTEINLLAHQTGFTVERSEEFLTGRMPSEATWGVAYLLRKSV